MYEVVFEEDFLDEEERYLYEVWFRGCFDGCSNYDEVEEDF